MRMRTFLPSGLAAAAILLISAALVSARTVEIQVTVTNLADPNRVSFAPLRLGFHNGTFDPFDEGEVVFNTGDIASAPIVSVAEGGTGSTWFPAFEAEDPTATLGSVGDGPLTPGATESATFVVDTELNQFFTFATMVVPSNDLFLGNDEPIMLFDDNGDLLLPSILQTGAAIWDAGSELAIAENAAFLVIGDNDLREDQGGTVEFDFSELAVYDGLETAAGFLFDSTLTGSDEIYQIDFEIIPEPSSFVLIGLGAGFGLIAFRRVRK